MKKKKINEMAEVTVDNKKFKVGDFIILADDLEKAKTNKSFHPIRNKILDIHKGFPMDKFPKQFQNFGKKLSDLYGDYVDNGFWVELDISGHKFWPLVGAEKAGAIAEAMTTGSTEDIAKKAFEFMKKKNSKFTDKGWEEVVDAEAGIGIPMSKWTSVEQLVKKMFSGVNEDVQMDRIMSKFNKEELTPEVMKKIQKFLSYVHDKKFELKDKSDSYIEKNIKKIIDTGKLKLGDFNVNEIYDGYKNASKAPVKIGDKVINVNVNKPREVKVTGVQYGAIDKLKADKKPSDDKIKELFAPYHTNMWWVSVDSGRHGTEVYPYGEDGVIKIEDAKNYLQESRSLLKDVEPSEEKTEEKTKTSVNEATFSKQHYIAIANILKTAKTKDEIVNKLTEFFKKDNPAFDTAKFIAYIGVEEKPTTPQEESENKEIKSTEEEK